MKMHRLIWLRLSGLFLLSGSFLLSGTCNSPALGEDDTNFISIFNGEDLTDWEAKGDCWEVRNGEIWCTGKSAQKNWLIWRKEQPSDFVLRLEFRWDKGNSGVQVRSKGLGNWQVQGYQVEVATKEKMGLWHHSLLDSEHPKKKARHLMATAGQQVTLAKDGDKSVHQFNDASHLQAKVKNHDWNSMEIIATGAKLVQKINGSVFSTVTDHDREMSRNRGLIALQDHGKGCVVAFRNIQLKTLHTKTLPLPE